VHGEEPDVPALDEVLEEYVEGRSVEGAEMEIFWVGKRKERKRRVFPKRIAEDPNRRFGTSAKRE
jgi:hypothetical protein